MINDHNKRSFSQEELRTNPRAYWLGKIFKSEKKKNKIMLHLRQKNISSGNKTPIN